MLERLAKGVQRRDPGMGGRWIAKTATSDDVPDHLKIWLTDWKLDGILNHEVREHMASDLVRYAYASAFATVHGYSPRGPEEFPPTLHPDHKNWISGKFVDRFKVQLAGSPSSTITSHLSKDGHYFIHPGPGQCAAFRKGGLHVADVPRHTSSRAPGERIQQVGNAVPPWRPSRLRRRSIPSSTLDQWRRLRLNLAR